jgi:hypothetical protein
MTAIIATALAETTVMTATAMTAAGMTAIVDELLRRLFWRRFLHFVGHNFSQL